ncbi:hypothetical protein [Neptunomonas sp.]
MTRLFRSVRCWIESVIGENIWGLMKISIYNNVSACTRVRADLGKQMIF